VDKAEVGVAGEVKVITGGVTVITGGVTVITAGVNVIEGVGVIGEPDLPE